MRFFHGLEPIQLQLQQETMVFLDLAFQGKFQFRDLAAQFLFSQLGHFLRGGFAVH